MTKYRRRSIFRWIEFQWVVLLPALCLFFLSDCSDFELSQTVTDPCTPLTELQIRKNQNFTNSAPKYATYAIMSNNAYPRKSPIPLPFGWKAVPEFRIESYNGLALAVYERHESDALIEVVVAFRGTDEMEDWIHNLIPFLRKQIPPAQIEFSRVLEFYNDRGVKIVTTGHSLGGGLAFHMSFIHPGIEAIVFNSSPVTKAGQKIHCNKRTSIAESGEAVQIPRKLASYRSRWDDVEHIKVRFLHGSPNQQHGMEDLALNLTKLGSLKSGDLRTVLESYCPH